MIAGLAVVAGSLAGCTADAAPESPVGETPSDRATSAPASVDEAAASRAACEGSGAVDSGAQEQANGAVTVTAEDGLPLVYKIAPEDVLDDVADRFCLESVELAKTNYTAASASLVAGEHLALAPEGWTDARRASGYLRPACPMHPAGFAEAASINWSSSLDDAETLRAEDIGTLIDTGQAEGATGTVRTDAAGQLVDYTIAAGDYWRGITDRFCMNTYFVVSLTGEWLTEEVPIHPGDVIPLQPTYLEIRLPDQP